MSKTILDNIAQTIEQIAVFNEEANHKPLKKRRPYYKASLLFAASTVEAFVYLIIKKYCEENTIQYKNLKDYRLIHNFPDDLFKNTIGKVGIYESSNKDFKWKDDIGFQTMNMIGKKYNVFNSRLFKKLDKIRTKRNEIHIQSLGTNNIKYTKKDIDYAGSAIPKLIDISKKYGIT